MDLDDNQLMYIPDEIATSGLRSKSGSEDHFAIISRLRNLLIDLSTEALRDMNIGRNQRAKRFLSMLSEINLGAVQRKSFSAKEVICSDNIHKPSTMRANSPRGLII